MAFALFTEAQEEVLISLDGLHEKLAIPVVRRKNTEMEKFANNQNHCVLRLRGGGGGYGDEDDGSTSTKVEEEGSIIIGDPVGISFDDTSTDSCDLQIAEDVRLVEK